MQVHESSNFRGPPNNNSATPTMELIRTGITCKKVPLEKSIEFGMASKSSATRYKQKTEIFLVTRPQTC